MIKKSNHFLFLIARFYKVSNDFNGLLVDKIGKQDNLKYNNINYLFVATLNLV